MTKMIGFGAVALCAAVACAEVTSANVVGFQNQNATEFSAYTWMANTFKKVDGTTVKLGDFKLVDAYGPTTVLLYLMDENGATLVKDKKLQIFRYVHPDKCTTSNKWIPGWYYDELDGEPVVAAEYKKGDASAYWANGIDMPYGQGFGLMKTTEEQARIVFSGAVSDSNAEVPITAFSGYTWTGNVMPTGVTFSNVSIKEAFGPTTVLVYFMDGETATLVKDKKLQIFRYVHPDKCTTSNKWLPGWYYDELDGEPVGPTEYKKGDTSAYWAGKIEIPAGQGLAILKTTEEDVHFVVPSPLVKAE